MNNPILRFPKESENTYPDWNIRTIESLCENILGGGTPSKSNTEYWEGTIPWISSSDLSLDKIRGFNVSRFISQDAIKHSSAKIIKKGSVLIVSRVGVGKVAVAPFNLCTSQDFTNLISVKCNRYFLAYALARMMKFKSKAVQGTAIKGIPASELKHVSLAIPCEEEQQKIANFFSTLDEKIELSERKLEALEQLKKGLMQKIFNQEIRFKSEKGSEYPSWESQLFIDISEISSASRVHKNEWGSKGIRFFRSSDVVAAFNKVKNPMGEAFISQELYNRLSTKSGKLSKGDILVTGGGSIGIPYLIKDDVPLYSKDADLLWVKVKQDKVDGVFLYFYMLSNLFKKQLKTISHTGTISHLTIAQLKQFSIDLPSLEEQKKIGQFLQTVEKKIDVLHKEIAYTKKLKHGFMQLMFV